MIELDKQSKTTNNMDMSAQRWKGRLDAAFSLLSARGLNYSEGSTYFDVLSDILASPNFTTGEKEALKVLFQKGLTQTEGGSDPYGEHLGKVDYFYVQTHYPNDILSKLTEDKDYASMYQDEIEEEKRKKKVQRIKILKISIPAVIVLILGIVIYNLPYFAEKRAYSRTINDPSFETFNGYIAKYDNPEHLPDVLYRKALMCLGEKEISMSEKEDGDLSVPELGEDINSKSGTRVCIEILDSLKTLYPNHELSKRANVVIDSIWESEINRFVKLNPNSKAEPSLRAMYEMLNYMKQNKVYDIKLNLRSDVDLKEYTDFPASVRSVVESFTPQLQFKRVLRIKDYFGERDLKALEGDLVSELENSINNVFTPKFFSVVVNEDNRKLPDNLPVIDLGYTIKTQTINMVGMEIPNLWIYGEEKSSGMSFPSNLIPRQDEYILGIEISFNSDLKFPGQQTPWSIKINGSPADNINGVDDIRDGYKIMTKRCFAEFGKQLNQLLGLSKDE